MYHITAFDGDSIRRGMELILDSDNFLEYKSYMCYQLIKSYHGFCTQELDEEFFDFYSRKLGGQEQQKTEDKRSINIVNNYAGEMMGKLFVKKYFPQKSKQETGVRVCPEIASGREERGTKKWFQASKLRGCQEGSEDRNPRAVQGSQESRKGRCVDNRVRSI